jgi:putative DNA primase/helicase
MNRILGDYARVLPFASLLHNDKKNGSDASPDLARLPGSRMVMAAEPDVGAKFSESILKQLTGGEKMTARHLHKDFFEFTPQFKICLSFNNKPIIRGQDEGIWRRILLVPFEQRYVEPHELEANPGAKLKDKDLEARLWEEAPGILNWMLDGYRLWAESGLQIPDKVRAATLEYRHESNPVYELVDVWCELVPGGQIQAGRLYELYVLWCRENAIDPMSQTRFGYKIKDMKIEKKRVSGTIFYTGIQANSIGAEKLSENDLKKSGRKAGEDD